MTELQLNDDFAVQTCR